MPIIMIMNTYNIKTKTENKKYDLFLEFSVVYPRNRNLNCLC